ncbi:protein FAR1-RELATED SEQUENCE 5-like isoform X1 [Andrographis paniculata]|uniref:protein FAR1-RELATED SEQUENCE 5-like isoform X1 n=1 Tax=Andrographis paniculata TaxID=175694 RepID=UPI0021E770BA|nr:protein FAR1-RELATED SEQUENCE 5-like isoform X1 [Andrographis paniculata]
MDSTSGNGSREDVVSVDMNVDLAHTELGNGAGEVDAGKVSSIIRQLESRLAVGQVVADIEEAYSLYKTYALAKGFSVRKSKNRYFEKTQEVRLKVFLCNKEGEKHSKPKKGNRVKSDFKTGCKARLEISRERNSEWKVKQFHVDHNHELALPDETHLLKSARDMTVGVVGVLENMFSFGKGSSDALSYVEEECGEEDSRGLNVKDAYNLINVIKRSKIDSTDCRGLFQHFQNRASQNDCFFWDAEFNELGLMKNFFWRDNRCGVDYDYFGDVVSFDATYRINKYNLICAPFVGINHHGQNVMFGCAFLSDETVMTFEWLFKTFARAMGNKHPQTIFTNPCQTMSMAIENAFPNTCHRFCQWHIKKDAPSHLGSLNNNAKFKSLFKKCLDGCESEADFEATWNEMISNHGCHNNKWLNDMYEVRQKWSTAYYGNEFNAGLKSTCRSESGNHVLKEISDKATSLYNFVIAFEELVARWRAKEKNEDFNCKQGKLTRVVKHSPLLNHAGNVYTNAFYKKFEQELMNGTMANSRVSKFSCGGTSYMYEVISHETEQVRSLVFDTATMDVKCSCKKFEATGILCSHALLVFTTENVHKIPERYIVSRWTTNVKNKIEHSDPRTGNDSEVVYSNQIMRFTHDLIMRSKSHLETREILARCLEDAASKIDSFFVRLNSETNSSRHTGMNNAVSIMEAIGINSDTGGVDAPVESRRVSNAALSLCEISNKRKPPQTGESSVYNAGKLKKNPRDKFQPCPPQMSNPGLSQSVMPRACEQPTYPTQATPIMLHSIHTEINAPSQMFYALPTGNNGMHAQGATRDS